MTRVTERTRRHVAAFAALLALAPSGCTGNDGGNITAVGDPNSSGRSALPDGDDQPADQQTQQPADQPGSSVAAGEPSERGDEGTTTIGGRPTPAISLLAAVDAYQGELGTTAPIRVLELTVWFPEYGPAYASLQSQDPAAPNNIDQRDWRVARVEDPEPVKLTGDGSLEDNLFGLDTVNWPGIAAALAGAPNLVAQKLGVTLENSQGVTHVIVTKDLPFSPNTVARVYVDGGDRSSGGYVQYLADGTLDKVQA